MSQPSLNELNESIELVSSYRERLYGELLRSAQKLQITKEKITLMLKDNEDLQKADAVLKELIQQRDIEA